MREDLKKALELEEYIIFLDTNLYLELYRFNPIIRNSLLKILETLEDKLYCSDLVKEEYNRNYYSVRDAYRFSETLRGVEHTIIKAKKEMNKRIEVLKKLKFSGTENLISNLENGLKELEDSILEFEESYEVIEEIKKKLDKEDEIFKLINRIGLSDRKLKSFSQEEKNDIYTEGKMRYREKKAPGYKDKKKKEKRGDNSKYSDLIIWKEVIKTSKEMNKNFVYVTGDKKEWDEVDNEKKFPENMRDEFYEKSGNTVIGVDINTFLDVAGEVKNIERPDEFKEILSITSEKYLEKLKKEEIPLEIIEEYYTGEILQEPYNFLGNKISLKGTYDTREIELLDVKKIEIINSEFQGIEEDKGVYKFDFKLRVEAESEELCYIKDTDIIQRMDEGRIHTLESEGTLILFREVEDYSIENVYETHVYDQKINIKVDKFEEINFIDKEDLCWKCKIREAVIEGEDGKGYCNKCGIQDDDGFMCPRCGRKLPYAQESNDGGICKSCS